MVAIIRFAVRPDEFELGRILRVPDAMTLNLETYIPSGDQSELFFSISTASADDRDEFVSHVAEHASVSDVETIDVFETRTLLAMDWNVSADLLLQSVQASNGQILRVTGTSDQWEFVVRFRVHTGIRSFRTHCDEHGIEFTLLRVYHVHEFGSESNMVPFGLTEPQREALLLAVREGYFDLPRRCSTADLAEELGISEQAVSERLRRGVANFVRHTLLDEATRSTDTS